MLKFQHQRVHHHFQFAPQVGSPQLHLYESVDGLNYDADAHSQKKWEACVLGKMQKKPFPKQSQHRVTRPYETAHSDECGPIQVESKGGRKYMLTFTDDFSRYTTAYYIKSKGKVLSKFMEFDALPSQITAGILGRSLQHTTHSSIERWI